MEDSDIGGNCEDIPSGDDDHTSEQSGIDCDGVLISAETGTVIIENISVAVYPYAKLSTQDLVDLYGEPDLVYIYDFNGIPECPWTSTDIHFFDMGLTARLVANHTLDYTITADSLIDRLAYHLPTSENQIRTSDSFKYLRDHLLLSDWVGYGDYAP